MKKNDLNYVHPKSQWTSPPKNSVKKPVQRNIIKIKLQDNPKYIVIKFADKQTLLKTLREMLGL